MSSRVEVIYLSENQTSQRMTLGDALANLLEDGLLSPLTHADIEWEITNGRGWWAGRLLDDNVNIVRADKVRPLLVP